MLFRSLAVTLILFEHLQNKAQAAQLKEDVISSYFTGIMAHRIAIKCGVPDREEGFVCGVFHHLGRMLATYYFFDESAAIARRIQHGETEHHASRAVLGVSHEELGIAVARSWNLPEKIVNSMRHMGETKAVKPGTPDDKLKLTSNLATALCRIASETGPARKTAELAALKRQYGATLSLDKDQLAEVVDDSIKEFLTESALFVTNTGQSRVLQAITCWSAGDNVASAADGAAAEIGRAHV